MDKFMGMVSKISAVIGVLVCILAGLIRIAGNYHVLGIEAQTIFIVGMSGMLLSILIKLHFKNS